MLDELYVLIVFTKETLMWLSVSEFSTSGHENIVQNVCEKTFNVNSDSTTPNPTKFLFSENFIQSKSSGSSKNQEYFIQD